MTTATAVGAISSEAAEWYAIDWPTIQRNVRRLQVRIVQATKESRWGKVKSLQRLLTHSYSGKVRVGQQTLQGFYFAPSAFLRCLHDTDLESANVALDGRPVNGIPFRRFA